MIPRSGRLRQLRTLVRTFLARFFENEITAGTDDLKTVFFALLAILAVPGFVLPILLAYASGPEPAAIGPGTDPAGWGWSLIARFQGVEALRLVSRADKTFYLGFAMIASGIVSAVTWNTLLVDRRDGLILGALPVRATTIVIAKLAALAVYVSIVAAVMHALASLSFGTFLASRNTFGSALRGIAAHFVASFGASAFVMLLVAGLQGLGLALVGPRLYARVSAALHMAVVALILTGLFTLPAISGAVVSTLGAGDTHHWILSTPPLWFLGIYERVLGTTDATLLGLSRTAVLSMCASGAAIICSYPVAYRRVMAAVVSAPVGDVSRRSATAIRILSAATGSDPGVRAVAQFFLGTLTRGSRQRLVVASAAGAAAAWGLPAWFSLAAPPQAPTVSLLSWALTTPLFLLAGFRIAAWLPSDLQAAWPFEMSAPSWRQTRTAMERTMFAVAVLIVAAFAIGYSWLWGAQAACLHAIFSVSMTALVIETLLWRFDGVPFTRPWDGRVLAPRTAWVAYLGAFVMLSPGLPGLELLLLRHPAALICFSAYVFALAVRLRTEALKLGPVTPDDAVDVLTAALRAGKAPADDDARIRPAAIARGRGLFDAFGGSAEPAFEWDRVPAELRRLPGALGRDLRLAVRRLLAAPIFTLFSILTLGGGVGVTTTVYSIVYAVLWTPPAIRDPDRVLNLSGRAGQTLSVAFSWPDYIDLRGRLTTFSGLAAATYFDRLPFVSGQVGEMVYGEAVNGEYFQTLGAAPAAGRLIQPSDDRAGAPPVVVLSYSLWRLRFGANADVVGRPVKIDGRPYEVVGIAPEGFRGWDVGNLSRAPGVWVTFSSAPDEVQDRIALGSRDWRWIVIKGRLAPGRTKDQASAELAAFGRGLEETFPSRGASGMPQRGRHWSAGPIRDGDRPGLGTVGTLFIGVVAIVLLIGCTNLANLALARGASREHERSVRTALGASRADLVREQIVESLLVATASGVLAALVIRALTTWLIVEIPAGPGQFVLLNPHVNVSVLVFATATSLCALAIVAIWPALQLTRSSIRASLSSGGGSTPPHWRLHRRLIGWQVAASVALFLVAASCINAVAAYARHDSGIDVDRLAIAGINFTINRYDRARARAAIDVIGKVAGRQPEVAAVAASGGLPYGVGLPGHWLAGRSDAAFGPGSAEPVQFVAAAPELFRTLGIGIVRGRAFDVRDSSTTMPVVVVNRAFAIRLWGSAEVVGRELRLGRAGDPQKTAPPTNVTVVGVAADTDVGRAGSRDHGVVYVPLEQSDTSNVLVTVRAAGDPRAALAALRSAIRQFDPDLVVDHAEVASLFLAGPYVILGFVAALVTTLGGLGLVLAMTGLFGVVSHLVSRRTRELGVRLALGAGRERIMRLVFADGLRPVVEGLVLGSFLGAVCRAVIAATVASSVPAVDPIAFVVVPIVFVATALGACYWPARRAGRVDPNVALREP